MYKNGFSLIELLVAIGVWGVLISTVGVGINTIYKSQRNIENRLEASQFANAILNYAQSKDFCSTDLIGKKLKISDTKSEGTSISFSNYKGFGDKDYKIAPGSEITNTLRIKDIRLYRNMNIAPYSIILNGATHRTFVARINLELESKVNNKYNQLRDRFIEFPVIVDSKDIISECKTELSKEEACKTIGGIFKGNECTPNEKCEVQGSYVINYCSKPGDKNCLPSQINNLTKGSSCPSGSQANLLYYTEQKTSVNCGKKCSYELTNKLSTYLCLKCPVGF